jgi:hypothetical protein
VTSKKRVSVDREEYEALVEGNERAHDEKVRLELAKISVDENLGACMAINRTQVDRLVQQDLLINDLRIKLVDMQGRMNTTEARIRSMELTTATTSAMEKK